MFYKFNEKKNNFSSSILNFHPSLQKFLSSDGIKYIYTLRDVYIVFKAYMYLLSSDEGHFCRLDIHLKWNCLT